MWQSYPLTEISPYSALIPLAASLIVFRRLDRPLRILARMFLLAVLFEAASLYLVHLGNTNLWMVHFWTPVEYACTILAFAHWQKNRTLQKYLRLSVPVFILVVAVNKVTIESFDTWDSFSRPISSTVIVLVAMITFHRLVVDPGESLRCDPRFWVSTAVLIYHAGTLTLFTLGRSFMAHDMKAFEAIYEVHSAINILTNLIFAGGFLCRLRR